MAVIAWAGWGVLLAALLVGVVMSIFERQHSPEVSPGMGPLVFGVLIAMLLSFGGLLHWFVHKQWTAGIVVMAILFWWPGLLTAARPIVLAVQAWRWEREDAHEAEAAAAATAGDEETQTDDR